MTNLFEGYLFHADNWDNNILDFKQKVGMCIDRRNFIALYAISPDLLHTALCQVLRENPKTVELTAYEKENLEELVKTTMLYIISTTFIADREIKAYLKSLEVKMKDLVAGNSAQAMINKYPKW